MISPFAANSSKLFLHYINCGYGLQKRDSWKRFRCNEKKNHIRHVHIETELKKIVRQAYSNHAVWSKIGKKCNFK